MAYPVQEIEGIGPSYGETLQGVGVRTTDQLLVKGATPTGRTLLSEQTGIGYSQILRWCNQADLMRIRGVGRQYAELLEAAGVDTVRELAQRNPANLASKLRETNDSKKLARVTPAGSSVMAWVEQAKTMEAMITY